MVFGVIIIDAFKTIKTRRTLKSDLQYFMCHRKDDWQYILNHKSESTLMKVDTTHKFMLMTFIRTRDILRKR